MRRTVGALISASDESSPAFLPGFFESALGAILATSAITEAARTGAGFGWHEQAHEVHWGCEHFEPGAGDQVEDHLNPVGRAYYSFRRCCALRRRCRRTWGSR